jgi:hypothetical protein
MSQVKFFCLLWKGEPGYYDHKKCSMVSLLCVMEMIGKGTYMCEITNVARTWCIGKESRLMLPLAL